jgi:hypothetical protein
MRAAPLLLAAALALFQDQPPPLPQARVRLHHLHFQTDDFAPAMTGAVQVHGGTRAMLQGLGPGVRVEDVYLLFDRPAPDSLSPSPPSRGASLEERFAAAAAWLGARRLDVAWSDAGRKLMTAAAADASFDHFGFATDDVPAVERLLHASGADPLRRTGESLFYLAGVEVIEITAETDRPDAFWCPMHPNVRAPGPGRCPICTMDLVPIAPPRAGEYRLDVIPHAASNGRGLDGLDLRIRDPGSGRDVEMFAEAHERLLHLFIIGRDLRYFAHEHPERNATGFSLRVPVPPGAYMLIADFIPGGGYPQMVHRAMVTPGYQASPFAMPAFIQEDVSDKVAEGVRVALRTEHVAGRPEALLHFRFTDDRTGAPANGLQLYLGSAGHLLVVSPDLTHSVHAHPEGSTAGPDISFRVLFPEPGPYKLWVQVQRAGRVVTAPFTVRIPE